ncbi:MAG: hypothetical protein ABI035_02185 [Gemmatimonadaceae bacterium]
MLFIFLPAMDSGIDYGHHDGAGGPGPVGGGGGGVGFGDNGAPRVHFVQITPRPTAAPVQPAPVVPPVVPVPPVAPPIVAPKSEVPRATPVATATQPVTASSAGTGTGAAGAGTTGAAGAGTGTGGGVGSGEGQGKGSGVGPGTGGGAAKNFPPSLKQFVLPPLPTPASVKGFTLTAWFDVDSTGKATLLRFTPTPDRGYNNRIRETLLAARFRPAVRPDGVAIRDTIDIQMSF